MTTNEEDKLAALLASHARLVKALDMVADHCASDGQPCWCLIGRASTHDACCNEARAALAEARKLEEGR